MKILVTGGTGFLGKALLSKLVYDSEYEEIILLVRSTRRKTPSERVDEIVRKIFPVGKFDEVRKKITVIEGDLTQENAGINAEDLKTLSLELDQILHIGASTDFGAPLDVARLSNVEGTRQILNIALACRRHGRLKRFDYVSTAFVAGTKAGWVNENDLVRNQKFANTYEQSKYEAEILVRSHMKELPTSIYRPSIVVGDSNHGYTPHFKVLYWPLRLLSRDILPFIACNVSASIDVVPVNYVTDGIFACLRNDAVVGEVMYLTAGEGNEVVVSSFLKDAYKYANINKVPIVPFWFFHLLRKTMIRKFFSDESWEAAELARPYYSYLKGTNVVFDAKYSQSFLESQGVTAPKWNKYKKEVLTYCSSSRWGRALPMPEYSYYLPSS